MLVLSRKCGEELVINDNISFRILGVVNNRVSIGIDAPKNIKILRSELTGVSRINKKSFISTSEEYDEAVRRSVELRAKLECVETMIRDYHDK